MHVLLPGEDFDRRTMDYMLKVFSKKTGMDASKDKKATQKLRREVRYRNDVPKVHTTASQFSRERFVNVLGQSLMLVRSLHSTMK
jgi:molecular chaperone DnaK (HSP70)